MKKKKNAKTPRNFIFFLVIVIAFISVVVTTITKKTQSYINSVKNNSLAEQQKNVKSECCK